MSIKTAHSEENAKTNACPLSVGGAGAGSRMKCIGSKCMAWQWERTHITPPDGGDMIESSDTHGFCGMVATRGLG